MWNCADTNGLQKFSVFADTLFSLNQNLFAGKVGEQTFVFKEDPFQIETIQKDIRVKKGNSEYYIIEKSGFMYLEPIRGLVKNPRKQFDEIRFWNDQILARSAKKWLFQPGKPEELAVDSFRVGENKLILFVKNGIVKVGLDLNQKFISTPEKDKIFSPAFNFVKIENTWVPLDSGIPIPERGKSFWWGDNILVDSSKGIGYIEGQIFSVKLRADSFSIINKRFLFLRNSRESFLITDEGKKIKIPKALNVVSISDSQCAIKTKKKWILIGISGQKSNVNSSVTALRHLRNGYISVQAGKRYGFIDPGGFIRIACRYDSVLEFEENLAGAKLGNNWGFLDQNERLQIQPNFKKVSSFLNGLAVVQKNEKYGLISSGGQFVLDLDFDEILPFHQNGWLIRRGKWWGYATKKGEITITPRFFNIIGANSTLMKIQRDGKAGLINRSGKLILDVQFKFISVETEFSNLLYYR